MSYNKNILLSLIMGYGLFSTHALAENYINSIPEKSTTPLIKLIQEKESDISKRELSLWQGNLTVTDESLINSLVATRLYDSFNAEIFVRSLEESEAVDLSELMNENNIVRARQAIAATVD